MRRNPADGAFAARGSLQCHNFYLKMFFSGVAMASNLGGMTSPISSPQNIFAIERMSMDEGGAPSWLAWFAVSLPVSILGAVLIWALLLAVYPPDVKAVHQLPELKASSLLWRTQPMC